MRDAVLLDELEVELSEWIKQRAKVVPIVERIERPANDWERFAALRELYAEIDPRSWDPYPYGINWLRVFTPIEDDVWCCLRYEGLRMWPQYPVGRYFLDFADPINRIAVECDGRDWHDKAKDQRRDAELFDMGWRVFRIPGAECRRVVGVDWFDADEYRREHGQQPPEVVEWLNRSAEGLIAALGKVFYGKSHGEISWDEAVQALSSHTYGAVA